MAISEFGWSSPKKRGRRRIDEIPWAAIERVRSSWLRRALGGGLTLEDAEDLFQDGLLAAVEGLDRLRVAPGQSPSDAFMGWFWGILRHKRSSFLRRRKRLERILSAHEPLRAPADVSRAADRVSLSLGLFARASPDGARVLRRRFLEGRQLSELASELGVSVPTACRRVQAALAEMRDRVEVVDV
jgi:RNA polymerase sigma factor (sigma-70 family)